jgi:hypothetical protein
MAITYRSEQDGRLTVQQMDGNFSYIEDYLQSLTASLASLGNSDPTYKVYTAKVEMSDGSATVFQNTLGAAVSWATGSGEITTGTIGALIGQNNVYVQVSSSTPSSNLPNIVSGQFTPSPWNVKVKQTDNTGNADNTQAVYVEIRVYD